ncbi:MAG: alpha/beta hydrolase [Clostridia bacterium]|nr:alpha/beta hydrolase [Clostridia bacterium]
MTIKSFDGVELYLNKQTDEADECVCVIVHGLAEHQGRYDYLAGKFNEAGIGTYRFDHRGHGRSSGERTYYNDFNELIDDVNAVVDMAIAENPDKPVFLLGHSMGGYGVSLYGVKYPDKKLRGIITSGALTHDKRQLIAGVPAGLDVHMTLPNELGPGVCSVKEVVEWYALDPYNCKTVTPGLYYALAEGVKWFSGKVKEFEYPVLMLHGENDALVSVEDTYEFFKICSSKDKQMKIYGNLFHEIFNEYCRDEVIADAISWILNRT